MLSLFLYSILFSNTKHNIHTYIHTYLRNTYITLMIVFYLVILNIKYIHT